MEYKLFEEFITLQALLKELGIIHSGGAIKSFLAEHHVYFNGELENRRGKKVRIGDSIDIPDMKIQIILTQPSLEEQEEYVKEKLEKERVAKLVKEMNKTAKKNPTKKTQKAETKTAPRFPGR
ncbi:S4 domain-containing protein YaaA [Streptococcus mitis]|uniref:S4 domain-containing protein YaaA n=1 Tax=Streptococcus mitis TaxID=28037 RepID=A0A7X1V449_STRMT|nr:MULTISPECIES: S4 domain-containing protein YaaA [Streptococcus]MQQ51537.1 S4 domain-containing protein YaaA [Streptococcus mitis]WNS72857.1 S4 domain-containing protein YaaA [Streptococcus sp. DTU_2020_1001019_1_SI_AUS_MUR_006]